MSVIFLSSPSVTVSPSIVFTARPSAPVNLLILDTHDDTATLSWQPPKDDGGAPISSYVVDLLNPGDTEYRPLATVAPDRTEFTAEGLLQGEKYGFRVRAKNAGGVSIEGAELAQPVLVPVSIGKWWGNLIFKKNYLFVFIVDLCLFSLNTF